MTVLTDLLLLHVIKTLPTVLNYTRDELREVVLDFLVTHKCLTEPPEVIEALVDIIEQYITIHTLTSH